MQKHLVYLATDANRTYIEAGYCQNVVHRLYELQQFGKPFRSGTSKIGRIVYIEEFSSFEDAQRRTKELATYTHMMKERIIRRKNPNWLNIGQPQLYDMKKAVAYA